MKLGRKSRGIAGLLPFLALGAPALGHASSLRGASSRFRSGATRTAYIDVTPASPAASEAKSATHTRGASSTAAFGGFSRGAMKRVPASAVPDSDDAIAEMLQDLGVPDDARRSSRMSGDTWLRPPKSSTSIIGYKRAAPYCDDAAYGVPGDSLGMCSGPAGTSVSCETSSDSTIQSFLGKCTGPPGGSNNPPTDIALSSSSIGQSSTGNGAVVGSLGTTDADGGDTHTYALVSNGASDYGTCGAAGDDDNASFQVDNANDDLETGGSLTAGSYNVCVETDDGTASYQESFPVTVNDDVPPSYENSTPSVSGTTVSQTTLTVRLSEIGTAYYAVVANGAGTPSAAQVKAGQDSGGGAAILSGSVSVSTASQDFTDSIAGLDPGTAYDIYVVAEDDEGTPNLQSSPTLVNVTTDSPDSDGDLTAAGGVSEPVALPTTVDTVGEAIDVFDFTLSDGGTADGLAMAVSQIVVNVSGTSTDTVRDQVTWRLNGNDASNVTGTYNAGADTITFSALSISVADGGSETYTVNAYYNDNSGLTEDQTFILSVDGDTDLSVGSSGTSMGATAAVTNGSGSTINVTASGLAFITQPSGSTSGSVLSTQPVVAAQDAFGNTDVDFTETVTLTEANAGSLSGDVDVAAVNGVATFTDVTYTATADQESFTLTANDVDGSGSNLPTADANAVTADVVATELEFGTEPGPTKVANGVATSFTTVPVVRAVDANGIVDTGYSTGIQLAEVNGAGSATMTGTGDQDGSGSTVTLTPSSGAATFSGLAVTYTPGGGAETFNLRASSGGLTTVDSTQLTANQVPSFDTASPTLDVNEDDGATAIDSLLAVTDADSGDTLTWSVSSAPSGGSLGGFSANGTSDGGSVAPTGLTYTPNADATGADSFDIRISDGYNADTITVAVSINARPTVTLSSGESDPTNTAPFDVTATFSESVTGFASGDINITNGSVSGVSGSGTTYTISVMPGGDGTVAVDVPANGATDTDGAGNEAATQFVIDYDATAPTAPSTPDLASGSDTGASSTDDVTSDTTPTLTGTAEAGSTIRISSNVDGTLGTTVADGTGSWSFTPGAAMSAATHGITATATDAAGNEGPSSGTLSVTIDTSAPTTPSVPDLSAGSDSGESATDDITNDDTPTLTGTAEASATVTISSNRDGSLGTTTADGSGNWSFTPGAAISEATHTFTATATDAAGNASVPSAGLVVVVDTTGPGALSTPDMDAGSDTGPSSTDNVTSDTTPAFSGTGDSNIVVSLTSNRDGSVGSASADGSGNWTVVANGLSEGSHTITATATDTAGNSTSSAGLGITVDVTAPTLTGTVPSDGVTDADYQSDLALTFSESVAGGNSGSTAIEIRDGSDGTLFESIDVSAATVSGNSVSVNPGTDLMPTGSYYVTVGGDAVTDVAGNAYAGIADSTTFNFTVDNAVPTAGDDTATTDEDNAVAVNVVANDSDVESGLNNASVTVQTAPANGSTSVNTATGVITYTPVADFNGADSFTYTVQDVHGGQSAPATVSLTVNAVNDAPRPGGDVISTPEDTALTIDVAANDADIDAGDSVDTASIVIVSPPADGTAIVNGGQVDYTPDLNFNGSDSFTYTIDDQAGATSAAAKVIVNVSSVNDVPVAANDAVGTDEDNAVVVDVLANDSDVDGTVDVTTVQVLDAPPNGTTSVDARTGEITYTPAADFNGTDSFTYVVSDDLDGTSSPGTVTVTVNSINDAPVAADDTATLSEDTPHEINVLGNDSDVDGTPDATTVEVVSDATDGTTSVDPATGAITYSPGENFNGADAFTYRVQDDLGEWSAPATVTLTVQPVNDPPLANDDTAGTDEDTAVDVDVLGNDSDVDGTLDATTVTVASGPANGSASVNGDGSIRYQPAADFNGSDSFTYTVDDDAGGTATAATVNITVNPVNDAPVVTGTPSATAVEGVAYGFTPAVSDVESDTVTVRATALPGWLSLDASTGTISGTPAAADVGNHTGIVLTFDDGTDTSTIGPFSIEVQADTDGDTTPDVVDADDDNDGMPDDFETDNGFDPLDPVDGGGDADGDGRSNADEYAEGGDPLVDDIAPVITIAGPVEIDATGLLTTLPADLPVPAANDALDGAVVATVASSQRGFEPGVHTLTWAAEDAAGNRTTATQTLHVQPLISLAKDQVRVEGATAQIRFLLNGQAPVYPLTVDYAVAGTANGADHDLTAGSVTFNAGEVEQSVTVNLVDDGVAEGAETVRVSLTGAGNFGARSEHVLTIAEANVAPSLDLSVRQGGEEVRIVAQDGGTVTFGAAVDDPNPRDSHSYEWIFPDTALVTAVGDSMRTLDPTTLAPGVYRVRLTVRDDGTPIMGVSDSQAFRVIPAAPALSNTDDSDGDGVDDATEGLGDSDEDGQPDYLDAVPLTNVLNEQQGDSGRFLIEADPGVQLNLGERALNNGSDGALLGDGEVAGDDTIPPDEVPNVGGYFDMIARDVPTAGASVNIVVPQRQAVPATPVYRKFVNGAWMTFVEDARNRLASAAGEEGICPPPGDDAYQPGLTPGDWCVQLTIEDGGPNDADGVINATVEDPGGVGALNESKVDARSGGGGAAGPLALLLLGLLAVLSRRPLRPGGPAGFLAAAVLGACVVTAPPASAEADPLWDGMYVDASLGFVDTYWNEGDFREALRDSGAQGSLEGVDETRTGFALTAGYRVTERWAAEIAYIDYGDIHWRQTLQTSNQAATREAIADEFPNSGRGVYLGGRWFHRLSPEFAVTASLGLWRWQNAFSVTLGNNEYDYDRDGVDVMYGFGFRIPVQRGLYMGGGFEGVSLDGDRQSRVGVLLGYRL